MEDLKHFLAKSDVFQGISAKGLEDIPQLLDEKTIPENEFVFKEDEYSDRFYILLDGAIRIGTRTTSRQNEMVSVHTLRPGDAFCLFSFVDGRRNLFSAKALKNSRTATFSRSALEELSRKNPGNALAIMLNIARLITDSARDINMMWRRSQ